MTENEVKALDFVRDRIIVAGFSPTLDEIGEAIGASRPGAYRVVTSLVRAGHLCRRPHKKRGIELPVAIDLRAVETDALEAELARRGRVAGAFAVPVRRAQSRRIVTCAACSTPVPFGHAFCRDHYFRIPAPLREEMLAAHSKARRCSSPDAVAQYQDAFGRALDAATTRYVDRGMQ